MNWFKKSIYMKLLTGMLIATVVPLALANVISYRTASDSVKRQIITVNQNAMNIGMGNIQNYFKELNMLASSYFKDYELMRYLNSSGRLDPVQSLYVVQQIKNIYSNRPEIRGVRYRSFLTGQSFTQTDSGAKVEFDDTPIPDTTADWAVEQQYEVAGSGSERFLSYNKLLIDYPSPTVIGMTTLVVGMDEIARISRILAEPSQNSVVFMLIRKDMKLMFSTEQDSEAESRIDLYKPKFTGDRGAVGGKLHNQQGIYIYYNSTYQNLPLTIVKFVPEATINESADKTLNLSVVIQLVSVLFIIVFASILSYVMIKPIKRILRTIANVEAGRFDVNPQTGANDELGILENRFKTMIGNLDDLVNREYRTKLELSTTRLKVLQAQINPHFLYNTLQYIGTLALRRRAPEVSDKIAELGAIFRYNMDMKTEIVPIETELQHMENYLSLQTGRFKNKLVYRIECAEEALKLPIPKMVLQPLVENSIVHGIEKGSGSGEIRIVIEWTDTLSIRIIDNGKGIQPAVIERVRADYQASQLSRSHIGLSNVLQRLRIFGGGEFEWRIESASYRATVITLLIPIRQVKELPNGESTDR